ncbi:DUF3244 domain-containing protein [Bacteroides rodentium]
MNLKNLFILFVFSFLLFSEASANFISPNSEEIVLFANDEPFKCPDTPENTPRSMPLLLPFSAYLNDDFSIDLDFYHAIGEVEITIFQNGDVIYSSSENIESPILKNIQLPQGSSGAFLLEIRNGEGAYAFGNFDL